MKTIKEKYLVVGADFAGYPLKEAFDYETYKKNGFKVNKLGDYDLKLETKPD